MKLSEILGWEKVAEETGHPLVVHGHNTALESCDREIDREALAKALYDENCGDVLNLSWEKAGYATHGLYIEKAEKLVSTMPTWLKRIDGK